jgi:putative heme transporter
MAAVKAAWSLSFWSASASAASRNRAQRPGAAYHLAVDIADGHPEAEAAPASASMPDTKPPSRRDALIRIGIVAGVLAIVFGIIMPRFVDYQEVIASLQGLTLQEFLVDALFGLIAWVLTGAIFTALIPGLGLVRGLQSYLILTGIGASIPLGPWNMAVLWVVIRGWGRPVSTTTGGILLYGIFDQLSRFGLMFVAGIVLLFAEAANRGLSVETSLIVGYLVVGGALFLGLGVGLILVVRSERLARKLGRLAERIVGAVLHRIHRAVPDIEGALVRFRVTLGDTVQQRGLVAFIVAMVSKFAWALLMLVSLRVVGVDDSTIPASIVLAAVAGVFVICVLPISPGGAGVPELLYITFFTTYTGGADSSAITAGVMLFRGFQWLYPIPLAWILLGISRRGKPLLPTKAEFQGGSQADGASASPATA